MDKQKMIENLNDDLASEYAAIIQYLTYAAKANGPFRPQLKSFFEQEIQDELTHAQYLANKIVALGGEPTVTPKSVAKVTDNKSMIEEVLKAENRAKSGYTQRAEEAEAYGDKGMVVQLEDMVRDESEHSEETERILKDWPL